MRTKKFRIISVIIAMVLVTGVGMAYSNRFGAGNALNHGEITRGGTVGLNLSASLVQDHILAGGEGIFELTVEMSAPESSVEDNVHVKNVDMVLVLDSLELVTSL